MYSKEESQRIKKDFWIAFAKKYPRKWVLYDTKIKDFSFKFYVDNKKAQILLDIEHRNEETRLSYYNQMLALRTIIEEEYLLFFVYEKNYILENGKTISRIWLELGDKGFANRENWEVIFDFFYEKMNLLETFYLEYDEVIKAAIRN